MWDKRKQKTEVDKTNKFKYLDSLDDNTPRAFDEYNAEASILDREISKPSVCNIAVVAKYGAGKSSVINTYLHNYRRTKKEAKKNVVLGKPEKNKYSRITLATFNNANYDETAIERSILQQLLYSRKKSELPNSAVKRTNRTSLWKSLLFAFLLSAFILSIVFFSFEISGVYIWGKQINWVKYVFLGIISCSLIFFVFWLIYSKKLKRIKYKEFEVEMFAGKDENPIHTVSLINKFIDEVLYFFECVDINLVIFEDLDRLPTTEIFAKLRELNTIINGCRNKNEKVAFLYAVKDDLFQTQEERAKFFEFILPVVPVVNQVTTSDKLRELLGGCAQKNKKLVLTEKFIKDISTYIPDMRILKNTMNDYIIMYSKIFEDSDAQVDSLSSEKLFALSLYKNLFPYDYSLLEKNAGLIPMVVCMDKLRAQAVSDISREINQANERLKLINEEKIKSINELKYIFLGKICTLNYNCYNPKKVINILDENVSFIGLNHAYVGHPNYMNYFITMPNGATEILMPNGEHFADRERIIKEKCENDGNETKTVIAKLEKERKVIFEYSFIKLVERIGIDNIFTDNLFSEYIEKYSLELKSINDKTTDDETIIDNEIFKKQIKMQIDYLRLLIVNGYIDERYIEYTSNYKAQLIDPHDAQFIASIHLKKQCFDYIPFNIQKVIERLDDEDFNHYSIFNKVLFDNIQLIKEVDDRENTKKYDKFLKYIIESQDNEVVVAIEKYLIIAENDSIENFLSILLSIYPSLCSKLLKNNKLTSEKNNLLVTCMIKYTNGYLEQNIDNIIGNYVANHINYIEILNNAGKDNAVTFLNEIKPVIKNLVNFEINDEVQSFIIEHNLYEISLHNLERIFKIGNGEKAVNNFYTRQYSFIMDSSNKSVIDYISKNINQYVKEVLLHDKVSLESEPLEKIDTLLKNNDIDIELRKALINKINVQIESIVEYDSRLYFTLLSAKKILATWQNVIAAYSQIGYLDEGVGDYILTTEISGEFEWCNDEDGKIAFALYRDILANYLCNLDDVSKILNTINIKYELSQFNISQILNEHSTMTTNNVKMVDKNFSVAIMLGQIAFCDNDFQQLYLLPVSLNSYIKNYEIEIIDNFDSFFSSIISQRSQPLQQNVSILIGEIIKSDDVGKKIKDLLLEKCLLIIDIKGYEIHYAKYFIAFQIAVPTQILWQFTNASMVSVEDKTTLLYLAINAEVDIELDKIKEYLKALGGWWAKLYEEGSQKVKQDNNIEKILKALKNREVIKYRRSNKIEEFLGRPGFIVQVK